MARRGGEQFYEQPPEEEKSTSSDQKEEENSSKDYLYTVERKITVLNFWCVPQRERERKE